MKSRYALFAATVLLVAGSATASQAPSATAVVDADGTLNRGLNALSATHLATGQYEVAFNSNVSECGYTAAVGLSGNAGSSAFGTVNVAKRGGNKKAIFVQTFDVGGNLADLGFHAIVQC